MSVRLPVKCSVRTICCCCRKLLAATIRANMTNHFLYVASDSWGAKNYPVKGQERAAEGAITILPRRNNILGERAILYVFGLRSETSFRRCCTKSCRSYPCACSAGRAASRCGQASV